MLTAAPLPSYVGNIAGTTAKKHNMHQVGRKWCVCATAAFQNPLKSKASQDKAACKPYSPSGMPVLPMVYKHYAAVCCNVAVEEANRGSGAAVLRACRCADGADATHMLAMCLHWTSDAVTGQACAASALSYLACCSGISADPTGMQLSGRKHSG